MSNVPPIPDAPAISQGSGQSLLEKFDSAVHGHAALVITLAVIFSLIVSVSVFIFVAMFFCIRRRLKGPSDELEAAGARFTEQAWNQLFSSSSFERPCRADCLFLTTRHGRSQVVSRARIDTPVPVFNVDSHPDVDYKHASHALMPLPWTLSSPAASNYNVHTADVIFSTPNEGQSPAPAYNAPYTSASPPGYFSHALAAAPFSGPQQGYSLVPAYDASCAPHARFFEHATRRNCTRDVPLPH